MDQRQAEQRGSGAIFPNVPHGGQRLGTKQVGMKSLFLATNPGERAVESPGTHKNKSTVGRRDGKFGSDEKNWMSFPERQPHRCKKQECRDKNHHCCHDYPQVSSHEGAFATGATFASVLGVLLGPVIGLLGGYFGVRNLINSTRTPRERAFVTRYLWIVMAAVVVFIPTLLLFTSMGLPLWKRHPILFMTSEFAITAANSAFIFVSSWRFNRAFARIRGEEQRLHPDLFRAESLPTMWNVWEYRSRATLFGLPLVHCRSVRLPGQKLQPAVGWIASGELAYGILFASGVCAVGGISMGAVSVGVISIGGLGIGLLAFGGLALGGVALGGAAIGIIASGGIAVGWHAATGGVAAAHEIALGGVALAHHANDAVARDFLARHRWLDFSQTTPRNVFYTICFSPMFLMLMIGCWRRRITAKRAKQK